ncbi:MAG: multidrug efflux SMR transporter [Thermoguttaceae bacterium]|nr:multidrug efflux SMR transporter [Thermoguttaceae bacterium]
MGWTYVFIAAAFEVCWAIGLKYTNGLRNPLAMGFTLVTMLLSFGFLAQAIKQVPLGTAYPVWTGIGVVGTFVAGLVLFGETATTLRCTGCLLIVAGVVALKYA